MNALHVRLHFALSALVGLLVATQVAAQVVNFNFMEDYNSTNVNFGLGAAPDAVSNTYWNRVGPTSGAHPGNRATMYSSDGTTLTSIRFLFDVGGQDFGTGGAHLFADNLFRGYNYTDATGTSFSISGLTVGLTYDFYFYSESGALDSFRGVRFTLDGNQLELTATPAASFIEGTNYVKFTLTPGTSTLAGSYLTTGGEANFAGAQVAVAAVPEPSTYAVLAGTLALFGTIVLRRRGKAGPAG